MKKLLELRQQKAKLAEKMRTLLSTAENEKRNLNEDEVKQFDELRNQATELKANIERYEALADEERGQVQAPVEKADAQLSNDELRHYIKTGEIRSLSTTVQADGGYAVIPQLDKQVMRRLADDSVMRQICHVVRLPIGAKEYKKLVSAGGAVVNHGQEGQARTETTTPRLNEVTIALNSIYAYPKTTQEILDFGAVDVLAWLSEEIADTFVETEDADLIDGDGDKKARGLLQYPRDTAEDRTRAFGTFQKLEVNSADRIDGDKLIDLFYSLRSKYRRNAVWVMSSATAALVQKLKDKNGQYIWRDAMTAGGLPAIKNLPVYTLESMPSSGAGKAVIALGDFNRGYYIVDHETGTRTRPDNITEPGFYKVHVDKYLGGGAVDTNAIKFIETKA